MMDEDTWEDEFESWEIHYDFHETRDYKGLVAHCEAEVKRRPDDLHAAERLADAYMLNGEYEKVIEFTAKIHHECPDIPSFQHRILDALRALGKTEDDFDWSCRPKIVRLASDVADRCHDFLRPKRKPRSIHDLTREIVRGDYQAFTDDELLQYLKRDPRFVIVGDHSATADITVVRKSKSRTNG